MKYIKRFNEISLQDLPVVGGKNANLGHMITQLSQKGLRFANGYAITAKAYWYFLDHNNFVDSMKQMMGQLTDSRDITMLQKVGQEIRQLIISGVVPDDLAQEIVVAYQELSRQYKQETSDVAVRSSATAEDLPTASFAGQQESYLNVSGDKNVLESYVKCVASLFTDRAIIYRIEQKFDHFKVALSVGVQKMVRSDLGASGVSFSLDTETGFKDVVMIESSYGLGETIVKGLVTPDEFMVHKPTLEKGFRPIIKKKLGEKNRKMVYVHNGHQSTQLVSVEPKEINAFSLTDDEIIELARYVLIIDKHYSDLKQSWSPMDVEWAKDGIDGKLYIVQARPETIHTKHLAKKEHTMVQYRFVDGGTDQHKNDVIVSGLSIGQKIASGTARVIKDVKNINQVRDGDIIVTDMTDPDWVPAIRRAAGIVTNRGGRTCHAAIVSRELGIPAIVGVGDATEKISDESTITIDCSRGSVGYIYKGAIPFFVQKTVLTDVPKAPVDLMVNIADPAGAFQTSYLPVSGVGLARMEFVITNSIKIHPMALLHYEKITDQKVRDDIDKLTVAYEQKTDFFVQLLAQSVGMIAAAFFPRPVIVRLSDFKSNEYRNLIGGSYFEPMEENPMLGLRGASRYYHEKYRQAFALECKALQLVRKQMGLTNVSVMVPFVRSVGEAQKVLAEMARNGLVRGTDELKIIMMCEVPSNVVLIDEFSTFFDGFSIGSNDLTQLIVGVDRDSQLLAALFDERDMAVKKMMVMAIDGAHKSQRHIGICGQAPSDYPDIAQFLIENKIDYLSLNPDSILPFLLQYKK